jgi:hypothetical protein
MRAIRGSDPRPSNNLIRANAVNLQQSEVGYHYPNRRFAGLDEEKFAARLSLPPQVVASRQVAYGRADCEGLGVSRIETPTE